MGFFDNIGGILTAPMTGGLSLLGGGGGGGGAFGSGGLLNILGGNPSTSSPTTIPGVFGTGEAQGYGRQAVTTGNQSMDPSGMFDKYLNQSSNSNNPYSAPLQQAISNPNFSPQSDAQKNLVNQAYSGRQAQFNNLGIGDSPAAQSAVAAAGAGTLQNLNQNNVSNLLGAQGQYNQNSQAQMQSVLSNLAQQLQSRGLDINTLMGAANLGQIRPGGAQSTGGTQGLATDFGQIGSGIGGMRSG